MLAKFYKNTKQQHEGARHFCIRVIYKSMSPRELNFLSCKRRKFGSFCLTKAVSYIPTLKKIAFLIICAYISDRKIWYIRLANVMVSIEHGFFHLVCPSLLIMAVLCCSKYANIWHVYASCKHNFSATTTSSCKKAARQPA